MDIASIKKETQSILSSLIVSSAKGLTVNRLRRDYREETGQDLPFNKLGHSSFEQFLASIPETCQVNGYGPDAIVIPVINAKNKHINDMILKQKPPKSTSRYKSIRRSRGVYDNSHAPPPRPVQYKLPPGFCTNPNSHKMSIPPPHDYTIEQRSLKAQQCSRRPTAPRFENKNHNATQFIPPLMPTQHPNYNNHTHPAWNPSQNQSYDNTQFGAQRSNHQTPANRSYNNANPAVAPRFNNTPTDRNSSQNPIYNQYRVDGYQNHSQTDRNTSQNQTYNSSNQWQSQCNSQTSDAHQNDAIEFENNTRHESFNGSQNERGEAQFNSQSETSTIKHTSIAERIASFAEQSRSKRSNLENVASGPDEHVSDKNQCDTNTRFGEAAAYKYHNNDYDDYDFSNSEDDFSDGEDGNFVYRSDEDDATNTKFQSLTLNDNTQEYYKDVYNHEVPITEEVYQLGVKQAGHESRVNRKVREKLQKLIAEHPDGIWCSKLLKLYYDRFKSRLEPLEYGFTSVIQLCDDMPDIFHCVRPNRTDWKLYDKKNPKPGVCGTQVFSNYLRTLNASPDPNNTEPPLPSSFATASSYLYPSTVLKLGDVIPKQWLDKNGEEEDFIELAVSEVYDPSKFWIQLHGENTSTALYKLMDDMQLFYSAEFETYRLNEMNALLGLYCAALFMNEFHRAIIIKSFGDGTIKVYYIDYGTVGEVLVNETCLLHKSFAQLPQQAIRSRLSRVRPKEQNTMWPRSAQQFMLKLVSEKILIGTIISINEEEKILELVITDTTEPDIDIHINDALISNDFAVVGDKASVCSTSRAMVPNVHLYPNFVEIETGVAPCLSDLIKLLRLGQTYETIFDGYFLHPSSNCMHSTELFDLSSSSIFDNSISYISTNDQTIKLLGDEEQESPKAENFVDKVITLEAKTSEPLKEIEVINGDLAAKTTDSVAPTEVKNAWDSEILNDNKVEEAKQDDSLNEHRVAAENKAGFWETDESKSDDLWKRDNFKEKPRDTDIPYRKVKTPPGFENFKPRSNNPEFFGYPSMPIPTFPPYFATPMYPPPVPQYPFPPANYFPNYSIYNSYNNPYALNQFMMMQQQQHFHKTAQNFVEMQQFRPQYRSLPKPVEYLDSTLNSSMTNCNISNCATETNIAPTESSQSPEVVIENISPELPEETSIIDDCNVESNEALSNISETSDTQYYSNDEDDQQLNHSNVSNTPSIENKSSLLRSEHICERFVLKININNKTLHIIKIIDELYVVSQEIITSLLDSEATLKKWLKSKQLDNYSFPNKLINLVLYENMYNQLNGYTIPGLYAPNNLGCNVRLTLLKDVIGIIEKYGDHNMLPDLKSGIEHVNTESLWTILDSTD